MRRVLLALAVLLSVAACGESVPPLTTGIVTDKRHYEAFTDYIPVYTFDGKGQVTGFYVQEDYHPEEWLIDLREGDRTGYIPVNRTVFDLIQEGMRWE